MSKSKTDDELEQYRTVEGVSEREADLVDDHELKDRFGDDKQRHYDARQSGQKFVNMYDDPAAAIRESLSNAETACINRAEAELRDAGVDVGADVRETLERASDVCGYDAQIEVTYNRSPNANTLVIEDNGIGITPERYDILRSVGYSENHNDGDRAGQFGIGYMSQFMLCGVNGFFRLKTHPYADDCNPYSTAEYLANFEYLDGQKDTIGTRFEFPKLDGAAQNIDIADAVSRYAEGMQVTVLYRDFDDTGNETGASDEFLPTFIEASYPDDALVITVENDFYKAVMSPSEKVDGSGVTTFNVTMPIDRNAGRSYKTNPTMDAKWKWDFRSKREDGPIVECESNPSLVGMVPVEDTKYQMMDNTRAEGHVAMSDVPDDAIRMPKPASSRDSFMNGFDDFWNSVSLALQDEWRSIAAQRFQSIDSAADVIDCDEKPALMRAYKEFIGYYDDPDDSFIAEQIADTFDADVPNEACDSIRLMREDVSVVKEGHSSPHTKGAEISTKLWKVIDNYGSNVYTAKTISKKKAEIVWGLDAALVKVPTTELYDVFDSRFGWTPAKKLPHSNLSEKLPELDDDVADKWENKTTTTSSSSSGSTRTSRDPSSKTIRLRRGTRRRSKWKDMRVHRIVDKLENDEPIWSSRMYDFRYLVVLDQTEQNYTARYVASQSEKSTRIIAAKVPHYVYEHLIDKPNVYSSYDAAYGDNKHTEVELTNDDDPRVVSTDDLTEDNLFVRVSEKTASMFDEDEIIRAIGEDPSDYSTTRVVTNDLFDDVFVSTLDATIFSNRGMSVYYTQINMNHVDFVREVRLSNIDEDADHYEYVIGSRDFDDESDIDEALQIAKKLDMFE